MLFPLLLTAAAPLEYQSRAAITAAAARSGWATSGRLGLSCGWRSTPQGPLLLSPLPRAAVEAQGGRIGRRRRRSALPLFCREEGEEEGRFCPYPLHFPLISKETPPF